MSKRDGCALQWIGYKRSLDGYYIMVIKKDGTWLFGGSWTEEAVLELNAELGALGV